MPNSNPSLYETLRQVASDLADRIERMDDYLLAASKSPTMESRLKQCADSVHRKHEQLQCALESEDSDQMIFICTHLLKEIARFYKMLGATNEND